jgi:hypothetical protein
MTGKDTYLTTGQIAEIARVTVETVRNWMDTGKLPSVRKAPMNNRCALESDVREFLVKRDTIERPILLHGGILPPSSALDAWAAGFFDGEGSIGIWLGVGGVPRAKLTIVNTYKPAIELFWRAFGGYRTIQSHSNGRHRTVFRLVVTGEDGVRAVLERLHPYLVVKREQATLALRLIDRIQQFRVARGRRWVDDAALAELREIAAQARKLRFQTFDDVDRWP